MNKKPWESEQLPDASLYNPITTADHPLTPVLQDVVLQVTRGKGERHGGTSIPFWDQTWAIVAHDHGVGFLTGQAQKKLMEAAQSRIQKDAEAYERELLGAIAYLGMAILHTRKYGK